jgi:hypothetical protein
MLIENLRIVVATNLADDREGMVDIDPAPVAGLRLVWMSLVGDTKISA